MANWFYLAFIVTIALLHVVNNLGVPVSLLGSKSYSLFSGVQDALTQWWYGHNAVGFFLTAGFLGMMYYFVPKQAERPVYSYRLSIIHFWALIFLYIWAGPHHLHYTALPDWAQTLGMVFSIMLWMPSWGGMINGLMTLQRRLGQDAHRPDHPHDGDRRRLLRHVDLRRADDVDQDGQRAQRTIPTGPSATSIPGALGWVGMITLRRDLLHGAAALGPPAALLAAHGQLALLAGDPRHRHLRRGDVGGGHHAGPDVARIRRRTASSSTRSPRPSRRCIPTTSIRAFGGLLYLAGARPHGLQHLDDDPRQAASATSDADRRDRRRTRQPAE